MPHRLTWTPELIDRFWNGFAQTRLTELSFAKGAAPSLIKMFGDYLVPNGRHLDFGGGGGHLAEALIAAGCPTAVFEPSPGRADKVRDVLDGLDGFLGINDGSGTDEYDVVICLEVIEHILEEDLPDFLRRLTSSVRPGGRLILTCPNAEDLDLDSCLCPNCGSFFHRWQHLRTIKPAWLVDTLAASGFDKLWLGLVGFDPSAVDAWLASRSLPRTPSWRDRIKGWLGRLPPPAEPGPYDFDALISTRTRIVYVGVRRSCDRDVGL